MASSSSPASVDTPAKRTEQDAAAAANRLTTFFSSVAAKRELRRALKHSTKPAETIRAFQQEHSLHTMMARAFDTTPRHEMKKTRSQDQQTQEPLDSDAAILFLSRLGVRQYDVHKRIGDTLMKQLEAEIRKSKSTDALLSLLQSCWAFATTLAEMRPVLWAVLKQLGEATPLQVLEKLTERDAEGNLRHAEIFEPLPPLLKRLSWEADWDRRVPPGDTDGSTLKEYESTLLYQTIEPLIHQYCSNKILVDSADRLFVSTVRERRFLTKQRRALASTATAAGERGMIERSDVLDSGKAIAQLRSILCDTVGTASTFRPKLLYALFSILIAQHGNADTNQLGGSSNIRCCLVADVLLSAGGPLPRGYGHLVALSRVLDDSVQEGIVSDSALKKTQDILKLILLSDDDTTSSKVAQANESTTESQQQQVQEELSLASLRQLNKILTAGIDAMKDADPQNLFLNPVTDAIAPGYSKIIRKPFCIMQMEAKVAKNKYSSIDEWEKDVNLMFKNCIDYNRGPAGQWFRGEALRQKTVFRDEILSQARRLYQNEIVKRDLLEDSADRKRKALSDQVGLAPLPGSSRKRKKGNRGELIPSIPALASMLLADPLVVRLFVDRVLRDLRHGVMNGTTIPAAHVAAPSLLQILHLALWSRQICSVSGKKYLVPDSGMQQLGSGWVNAPFAGLRQVLPLLLRLVLEAELDRRISLGGDLHMAAQSVDIKVERIPKELWAAGEQMEVSVTLIQGIVVFLCQPGLRNETSLAITFPKLAIALQTLSPTLCDDQAFVLCLASTILRHKAKLPKGTRDAIVQSWLGWLKADRRGAVCTSAHVHLVRLLNDWSAFGNLLLPRDTLVKFTLDAVHAVDSTLAPEATTDMAFAKLWSNPDALSFAPVKEQYERMLKQLPENQVSEWKERAGISEIAKDETIVTSEAARDVMDVT